VTPKRILAIPSESIASKGIHSSESISERTQLNPLISQQSKQIQFSQSEFSHLEATLAESNQIHLPQNEFSHLKANPSESIWIRSIPSESIQVYSNPSESKQIQVNQNKSKRIRASPSKLNQIQANLLESTYPFVSK
jgi:hypothetical protein